MTIQTIVIPKGTVVSVNTEASIVVGTQMSISNNTPTHIAVIKESVTEPSADKTDGRILSGFTHPAFEVIIAASSDEIWAYAPDFDVTLCVQSA